MPPVTSPDSTQENPWTLAHAAARELDVGSGHRLWWAQGGVAASRAPAVLVIHGGPGGRSRDDPLSWLAGQPVRWLCWDQRGCGRSRSAQALRDNDLPHLLGDIDALLAAAQVERVAILAGSWGAVLGLEYLRTRPGRVAAMLLRSSFLGSRVEVDAFFAPWSDWLGAEGRAWLGCSMVSRSGALAWLGEDGTVSPRLAWAWAAFETLQAAPGGLARAPQRFEAPAVEPVPGDVASYQIQARFLMHDCDLDPVARAQWPRALAALPGPLALVHGADDAVCPAANSGWLAACRADARFERVAGAGHRMSDPLLAPRLREAAQAWCAALLANSD